MSDIVERLRDYDPTRANSREAADEIDRLRVMCSELDRERCIALAEIERLRAALDLERRRLAVSEAALRRALEPKP